VHLFKSQHLALILSTATPLLAQDSAPNDRKTEYVNAVTRGVGFLDWQQRPNSDAEQQFRQAVENRKDQMLADRVPVTHPIMLPPKTLAELRKKIKTVDWAKRWFKGEKAVADHVLALPPGYAEEMIPLLSPTRGYGFTCPNCVGKQSQEGTGYGGIHWSHKNPDVIRCRECDHVYPSEKYPETAKLVCPRTGQEFTYYLNDAERAHPNDRTGKYAYHWVDYPVHMSFTGIIRENKIAFARRAINALAFTYAVTEKPQYAQRAIALFERLAEGYRNWLYHDYWDTIADADPLYAAWHWNKLPLDFKRHLCTDAFAKDTLESARMLQTYWGCGRIHASTDGISQLQNLALAYDLIHDAKTADGTPLWSPATRAKVERDFFLEYIIGAEPYLGGRGKTDTVNNKSPRVYSAMAAVAQCLGLPEWADVALRGYQAIRDQSFDYDGFSHETPSYNNMYLAALVWIPERLHGFPWPKQSGRTGKIDLYATDARLGLMYGALIDQLSADARYLPLGDTNYGSGPSRTLYEIGLKRYPQRFAGTIPAVFKNRQPSEYGVLNLSPEDLDKDTGLPLEEIYFPRWMVAILRHGAPPNAAALSLSFSPAGGHRHADNLSLFYIDRARRILGDHGYVGDMPINKWIKDTRSHNLVVVDDKPQTFHNRKPALRRMFTTPTVSVVEAASDAYPQCTEYRRLVALIKGPDDQTIAVDVFRVTGGNQHAYRLYSELASSDAPKGSLAFDGLNMPPEKPLPKIGNSLNEEDIFGLRDMRFDKNPPPQFQALWNEDRDTYRAWILTQSDTVAAANAPGQQKRGAQVGRRVRYLDAIRTGENLSSTFVALHEPSGPNSIMPIQSAEQLTVPPQAGPTAVALRIKTNWGTYLLLNEFTAETQIDNVKFKGDFALVHSRPDGQRTLIAHGAETLQDNQLGFTKKPAHWSAPVIRFTESRIEPETQRPKNWPPLPKDCSNYVLFNDGEYDTGLPIKLVEPSTINVARFPVPQAKHFTLPALQVIHK
jgi:hypothetical protein